MSEIRRLLDRSQPGPRSSVREHVARGERIQALIAERWAIHNPRQWKAKHARWVLEVGLADRAPATRYHHYRTLRSLAAAMGRWQQWESHLRGPWQRPTGASGPMGKGRPAQLAHRTRR